MKNEITNTEREQFSYVVIPVEICYATFSSKPHVPKEWTGEVHQDDLTLFKEAMREGYRWVRTENGKAVFERRFGPKTENGHVNN